MDPPACVQNAMMTKDKKPFTYTPGGIDLSEVKSPRMARRIEQNAHLAGAGDLPKPQAPYPVNVGSLPPSTLAAMRPQPQVQVFPSGPAPPASRRGGAPPPPPPPCNAPPPPPPPTGPLPTQKFELGDNQILERPDMTKIIPDNPMALLRKTGGPQPRKSLVDEMFAHGGTSAPTPKSPPTSAMRPSQFEQQESQRYQPPVIERGAPISPVPQQRPQYQPQAQPTPPQQYQPPKQQFQPTKQYQSPPVQQQRTPELAREQPSYQPPIIERQPSVTRPNNVQPEIKTSTAQLGSLYIPPINQQQQHKRVVSPPSPPERSPDSPGIQSPSLKEAPKPWQAKKPQEDVPTWAMKEEQAQGPSPPVQHHQQNWPQSRPAPPNQQQPYNQPIGIRIDIHTKPTSPYQDASEEKNPNAVYVTQPVVLQHPGGRQPPQYQQQPKIDNQGARIIPVKVEGSNQGSRTPSTPGSERSLNRQQSWGSNPTQSNSFKIIQKITQTDDDEDENAPITEHSAKFPQNYQQQVDQMRKMQVNEGNQNMNFRQVPRGPQIAGNKGPQVRTIPIQIEGDEASRPYVHPSEQVVPEPKKYTGSSIPGRSFKILQTMTAPNNCANVDDPNEASLYDQWGYDPHYPSYPPPPPYWHDYYHNCFYPDPSAGFSNGESSDNSTKSTPRQTPTPLPFWGGYMPPYSCPMPRGPPATSEKENDAETTANPRATPLPFWGYGYPYYPPSEEAEGENPCAETPQNYPQYPPYYDPYYYHYYYGYPPMYPPYPYYGMSEAEDFAGYSSTDEMAAYNKTNKATTDTKPKPETTYPKANTTLIEEQVINHFSEAEETDKESSDSESDQEDEKDMKQNQCNPLKSIRSVNNIHVYDDGENVTDDEIIIEGCSEGSDEDTDEEGSICIAEDDGYPHQLSVILEESERAESRLRSPSALSDSTTIADRSDDEEGDPHPVTITLPVKLCVTVTEENHKAFTSVDTVENANLKTLEDNEIYTSFTLKSPSLTPRKRSPCRFDNTEEVIESKCDVSEAINLITEEELDDEDGKDSDESEDWWGILGKEDDFPKPKKVEPKVEDVELEESKEIQYKKEEVANLSENNYASANNSIKEDDFPKPKQVEPKVEDVELEESKEIQYKKEEVANLSENNYASANNSISNENIDEKTKDEKPCNNEESVSIKSCASSSKTVYDAVEDTEEENSGTLIEMESFVAKLEKIQKESGLWNSEREMVKKTEFICKEKTTIKSSNVRENSHINLVEETTHTDKNTKKYSESKDEANEDIDFWSTIKNDKETLEVKSKKEISDDSSTNYTEYNYSESKSEVWKENKSQHVRNKLRGSINNCYENNAQPTECSNEAGSEESSDDTDSSSSDEEVITADKSRQNDVNNNQENEVKVPSIKERIQALKDSIKQKQSKTNESDIKISVKEKVSAIEVPSQNRSKTTSTKSSLKSFEEFSEEEEVDSGVTSDMSRHISDTEEFPELNKLTRYQRAATHSRLFKLLQEECDNEDQEEAKAKELADKEKNISKEEPRRRDQLSLPLNKSSDSDSFYSSGINSPNSPVNERLVNELVQSLLKRKKGQAFRNMAKEKLYAAAAKILQEHIDDMETPSDDCNSLLSPLRDSTGYSTAAQTPQEFNGNYDEYKEYYDTWSEAGRLYDDNYDILPSKAFRLLQEHSSSNRTGVIAGLLAKCPRVLSSKNIHRKLLKLLENPDNSSPTPDKPLDSNEVTSAS